MLKLKMPGNPGIFNLGNSINSLNVITELTHKSAVSTAKATVAGGSCILFMIISFFRFLCFLLSFFFQM